MDKWNDSQFQNRDLSSWGCSGPFWDGWGSLRIATVAELSHTLGLYIVDHCRWFLHCIRVMNSLRIHRVLFSIGSHSTRSQQLKDMAVWSPFSIPSEAPSWAVEDTGSMKNVLTNQLRQLSLWKVAKSGHEWPWYAGVRGLSYPWTGTSSSDRRNCGFSNMFLGGWWCRVPLLITPFQWGCLPHSHQQFPTSKPYLLKT